MCSKDTNTISLVVEPQVLLLLLLLASMTAACMGSGSGSAKIEEGLEVLEGELARSLGAGQHAISQLELLLLEVDDAGLDGVAAEKSEKRSEDGFQSLRCG